MQWKKPPWSLVTQISEVSGQLQTGYKHLCWQACQHSYRMKRYVPKMEKFKVSKPRWPKEKENYIIFIIDIWSSPPPPSSSHLYFSRSCSFPVGALFIDVITLTKQQPEEQYISFHIFPLSNRVDLIRDLRIAHIVYH